MMRGVTSFMDKTETIPTVKRRKQLEGMMVSRGAVIIAVIGIEI